MLVGIWTRRGHPCGVENIKDNPVSLGVSWTLEGLRHPTNRLTTEELYYSS